MSGHGGIQKRGAGKNVQSPCRGLRSVGVFTGQSKSALDLAPWVTVSGSLVLALCLTRSYTKILGCTEPAWDYPVRLLWLVIESKAEECLFQSRITLAFPSPG